MKTLDKEQIKRLHKKLLDATGGLDGSCNETMLNSALSAAFQTFDGLESYPSTTAKIARIADGNKRIGIYVMLILLELSKMDVDFTDEEIKWITVKVLYWILTVILYQRKMSLK